VNRIVGFTIRLLEGDVGHVFSIKNENHVSLFVIKCVYLKFAPLITASNLKSSSLKDASSIPCVCGTVDQSV
jgi:hypothetical protein